MISRLSGSVSCSLRISSLRRKAGRRVARNEPRDVKRRRAATGLARARLRAHTEQFLGAGVPSAVAWRMARALRGWGQSRRWACEHAMILPSALGDQAKGRANGYLARAERVRVSFKGSCGGIFFPKLKSCLYGSVLEVESICAVTAYGTGSEVACPSKDPIHGGVHRGYGSFLHSHDTGHA